MIKRWSIIKRTKEPFNVDGREFSAYVIGWFLSEDECARYIQMDHPQLGFSYEIVPHVVVNAPALPRDQL